MGPKTTRLAVPGSSREGQFHKKTPYLGQNGPKSGPRSPFGPELTKNSTFRSKKRTFSSKNWFYSKWPSNALEKKEKTVKFYEKWPFSEKRSPNRGPGRPNSIIKHRIFPKRTPKTRSSFRGQKRAVFRQIWRFRTQKMTFS